jgi:hypothetical protein
LVRFWGFVLFYEQIDVLLGGGWNLAMDSTRFRKPSNVLMDSYFQDLFHTLAGGMVYEMKLEE